LIPSLPRHIQSFDERYLVINIRTGDIFSGVNRLYPLIPVNFYADLIRTTGLLPVFVGEIQSNAYVQELRERFPAALFLPRQTPVDDFETIRRAKNIVIAVSTFSWMAAWLSMADKIYMPIAGFYNHELAPEIDLLPVSDPRYRFYEFPSGFTGSGSDYQESHAAIDGQWKEMAPARPLPAHTDQPAGGEIIFLQTADSSVYKAMLDLTSRVNILYCQRHDIRYECYIGVKKGVVPWQATYNRIFMLHELLERGFRGWAAFVDADAFVVDLAFDLRAYLRANSEYCLIGATGGNDTPWNLNAGILFINFGDADGRAFVIDWLARFNAVVPAAFLASPEAAWDDDLNDQALMYDCIRLNPDILRKTKKEDRGLFNYRDAAFIKQAIRAGFPGLSERMQWIHSEIAKVVGPEAAPKDDAAAVHPADYVDLTGLANRYGSDKGTEVGNKHGYTQFYEFLFEAIRTENFSFLELGLLRGGPEVGGSDNRVATEAPSVRMWLDYFPRAICHGFDISDFSGVKLGRFHFHRGDLGSAEDLARLRAELPRLRFIVDDASHASYHQQLAFATLFPLVEPGGYYVIEDLDWQPEAYEGRLPRCRLTRDLMLDFANFQRLDIDFLPDISRRTLASRIGEIHMHRRRGDGMLKLVAIQRAI
jgi:hypothetical protein